MIDGESYKELMDVLAKLLTDSRGEKPTEGGKPKKMTIVTIQKGRGGKIPKVPDSSMMEDED